MTTKNQDKQKDQDDLFIDAKYAAIVLERFKGFYADQYNQRYLNMSDKQVASEILFALHDVKVKQVALGMIEMRKRKFMPNFAEFRELCISASWLSVECAWAMALNYNAGFSNEITSQALESYSEVKLIVENQGQKLAYKAFVGIYQRKIDDCQIKGIDQEFLKVKRIGITKPNVHSNGLSDEEQQKLNQANLEKLGQKLGRSFKKV